MKKAIVADRTMTAGRVGGKVALVTGCAADPGMGRSISHRLAAEGAQVVCTDWNGPGAEECAASIRAAGGKAQGCRLDVTSPDDWREVVASVIGTLGPIDILVNNAGVTVHKGIGETELADLRRLLSVNVEGPFLGIKAVLPSMKAKGGGSIVNIASIAGKVGAAKSLAYTASKSALLGLSKVVAVECGPVNIRCNTVHPGVIWTTMQMHSAQASQAEDVPYASLNPLGRMGEGEDIAQAVVYFASDESRYVTGAELFVDGGLTTALGFTAPASD